MMTTQAKLKELKKYLNYPEKLFVALNELPLNIGDEYIDVLVEIAETNANEYPVLEKAVYSLCRIDSEKTEGALNTLRDFFAENFDESVDMLLEDAAVSRIANKFVKEGRQDLSDELLNVFINADRRTKEVTLIKLIRQNVDPDIIVKLLLTTEEGINFQLNSALQPYSLLFECGETNNLALAKKLLESGIDLGSVMPGIGNIFAFIETFPGRYTAAFVKLVRSFRQSNDA